MGRESARSPTSKAVRRGCGGFCLLPTWVLSPPGTQPLPGRFEGGQTQVWTNYRSLRAGCCRAGPVPGHARAPAPARSPSSAAQRFLGKPGQHPHTGVARQQFQHFLRTYQKQRASPSILAGQPGLPLLGDPEAMSRVCDFGRREEDQCWERAGSVAKWSLWDSANLPRRKECRAGEMQSAGNCGCSSTPASPTSAGPEPPQRPLTPAQLPAPRGHVPFPVAWLHSGWKPPKLGIGSLLDTEPC